MLQHYSYSLPSTLRGRASRRGVKRKFDSFRCGYSSSSDSSNALETVSSPNIGQRQDRKKQLSLFHFEQKVLSTPVCQVNDAGAYFGRERVQSMDLDLSVAYKSSSFFNPSSSSPSTSSSSSFSLTGSSNVAIDSLESRGGKQQLGIKMFFNSTTSSRSNNNGEKRGLHAASIEKKEGLIETCVFCIVPQRQVFPGMASLSCAFCNRSSCPDCVTYCEICNQEFCKFCITTNYDHSFDKTVCLDCNGSNNDGASKIVYSF